jgi:DNA-binding transcriptional MerR regulator
MNDATYSLDELATLAELPRRTVRYYIQLGLVPAPEGSGRGAHYGTVHLDRLLQVRKWQLAGLSLERIAELVAQPDPSDDRPLPPTPRRPGTVEVWSHLVVADGVELTVEPGRAGLTPEQLRAFFRGITDLYDRVQRGKDLA